MSPRVGPFWVDQPIGRGGMGVVFAARTVEEDAPCAVKVLVGAGDTSRDQVAVHAEIRAVAGLDHLNIVRILDQGVIEPGSAHALSVPSGSPWFAMERVDGGTLADWTGRIGWTDLARVVLGLLDALAHAHAAGVLHRDMKPANVLMRDGRPVLTDFGLAHPFGALSSGDALEVVVSGTPSYMAPEVVDGDRRAWGPWTDLYGLGSVVWALVTGTSPFGHVPAGVARMLAHRDMRLPALRATAPVPSGFEAWIRRLLEKDPRDRFRHAADAAVEFAQLGPTERGAARDVRDRRSIGPLGPPETSPPLCGSPALAGWRGRVLRQVGVGLLGLRPPSLVGRSEEQARLWNALTAVAPGEARTVALVGPPGVGRSRLARWMTRTACELGAAEVVHSDHRPALGPTAGIVAALTRALAADRLVGQELREWLDEHPLVSRPEEVAALLDPGPAVASGPELRRAGLCRALEGFAGHRPGLLVLDDVALDPDMLLALPWILLHVHPPRGLLVVLTAVTREALGSSMGIEVIDVGPLSSAHTRRMVRELVDLAPAAAATLADLGQGLPGVTLARLVDAAGGGRLRQGPDGWTWTPGERMPDLAEGWKRTAARALASTERDERTSLGIAAALGERVLVEEWQAACSAAGVAPAWRLLEAWAAVGLVRIDPRGAQISFERAELREAVQDLERAEGRWTLAQGACADALQGRPGSAARGGRHLVAAGRLLEGAALLDTAAREADLRGELMIEAALIEEADAALGAAGTPADAPERRQRATERCRLAIIRGDRAAARHWHARAVDPSLPSVEHLLLESGILRMEGSFREATDVCAAALGRVRAGDLRLRARVVISLAWLLGLRGLRQEAQERFLEALDLYTEEGDRYGQVNALRGLANMYVLSGRPEEARDTLALGLRRARDGGFQLLLGHLLLVQGELDRHSGHLVEAAAAYREAAEHFEACACRDVGLARLNLACVELDRGDLDAAGAALATCLRWFSSGGDRSLLTGTHLALLVHAAASGDRAAFLRHLQETEAGLLATGWVDPDVERYARRAESAATGHGWTDGASRCGAMAWQQRAALDAAQG